MRKTNWKEIDKQSFLAMAAFLWLCCALVLGGILLALFGWQAGVLGIAISTILVLVGSLRFGRIDKGEIQ